MEELLIIQHFMDELGITQQLMEKLLITQHIIEEVHSCPWTLGQILGVITFAWKRGEQKGKNLDVGRGPSNITSSGSFETVGLGILI